LSLYVFACRLEDPFTANLVISEIQRLFGPSELPPGPKMLDLAFRSIEKWDYLRNLLVDLYIYDSRTPPNRSSSFVPGEFPHDFLDLFMERVLVLGKRTNRIALGHGYREGVENLGGNPAGLKT
jgi:hypothetical protein